MKEREKEGKEIRNDGKKVRRRWNEKVRMKETEDMCYHGSICSYYAKLRP